ncbi:hypothetical protein N9B73_00620 [Verrucomicrobiales bacterium]|jgi:hypothetical protein|nr:hypothetical protein [Verrucomicrobiales bacterium]
MKFQSHRTVLVTATAVTVAVLCAGTGSHGDEPLRAHSVLDAPAPERALKTPLSATLILERIDVTTLLYKRWITENTLLSDAASPLRESAQIWVKMGDAQIAETTTLQVRSGTSSKIESQQIKINDKGEALLPAEHSCTDMEASVTIEPNSHECSIRLNPTFFKASKSTFKSDGKAPAIRTTISLPRGSYGFLGSRPAERSPSERQKKAHATSLFFLRADIHLPSPSESSHTSQL